MVSVISGASSMKLCLKSVAAICLGWLSVNAAIAGDTDIKGLPTGWTTMAPRDEIKPLFRYDMNGGRDGREAFVITGDNREGTSGWWQKTFPIEGGKTYRFSAWRKDRGIMSPRQSGLARVQWRDAKGNSVKRDEPTAGRYLHGSKATAEPEYPTDKATDTAGWTEVSDVYEVPDQAREAIVEL